MFFSCPFIKQNANEEMFYDSKVAAENSQPYQTYEASDGSVFETRPNTAGMITEIEPRKISVLRGPKNLIED